MATTRIMPLHVGKGRTESRAISDIIDYVANPKKTDSKTTMDIYARVKYNKPEELFEVVNDALNQESFDEKSPISMVKE